MAEKYSTLFAIAYAAVTINLSLSYTLTNRFLVSGYIKNSHLQLSFVAYIDDEKYT
jgi:hypothetical protein